MPSVSDLTHSPLGVFIDTAAARLDLYRYGRRPFMFFATGLAATTLVLHALLQLRGIAGPNPSRPEWKMALHELNVQVSDIYSRLVYAGAFAIGVSQAVRKKADIFNPDLTYVFLYSKLVLFLLALEFVCNVLLQPTASGKSVAQQSNIAPIAAGLTWVRLMAGTTARQLVHGVATGFAYGYMIRGVGVLFEKYGPIKAAAPPS